MLQDGFWIFRKKKQQQPIFWLVLIVLTFVSASITEFDFMHGIATLPKAVVWIFSNLYITQESLEKLPKILEKLNETIFLSITSTTTASILALFFGLMGSNTTKVSGFFSTISRAIASLFEIYQ